MLNLPVENRDASVTPANLRRSGRVPGVVYGGKHKTNKVSVEARAFDKVLKDAGEATIVSLTGMGADMPVLIHEVDLDPITSRPRHIDFYAVTKGEKVHVAIPLVFVGESDAVKNGASLVKVLHEVEVVADPMTLPHAIEVNIAALLEVDDQLHVKDLVLPNGVSLVTEADEVIALAQGVSEEKKEEQADISSIEVEKKGREEKVTEQAA